MHARGWSGDCSPAALELQEASHYDLHACEEAGYALSTEILCTEQKSCQPERSTTLMKRMPSSMSRQERSLDWRRPAFSSNFSSASILKFTGVSSLHPSTRTLLTLVVAILTLDTFPGVPSS